MENSTFYPVNDCRYLAHHGVKGMKWGVRHDRYSKYRKNKDKYVRTNKVLDKMDKAKEGTPEHGRYKRKIKSAVSYDRGRALYSKGIGANDISRRSNIRRGLSGAGVAMAYTILPNNIVNLKLNGRPIASIPMNILAAGTIAAGSAVLEGMVGSLERRKIKDLRAYYSGGPKV